METNSFSIGDSIQFTLRRKRNVGNPETENVEALAIHRDEDRTLFILHDCLRDRHKMNERDSNEGGYSNSVMRKKLNGEILDMFPEEILEKMVPFANGDFLRLPTEEEIFGLNELGAAEEAEPVQLDGSSELVRNKLGDESSVWYWLQNVEEGSSTSFVGVSLSGKPASSHAGYRGGTRLMFQLKCDHQTENYGSDKTEACK